MVKCFSLRGVVLFQTIVEEFLELDGDFVHCLCKD